MAEEASGTSCSPWVNTVTGGLIPIGARAREVHP
jgi:hypothetical protein